MQDPSNLIEGIRKLRLKLFRNFRKYALTFPISAFPELETGIRKLGLKLDLSRRSVPYTHAIVSQLGVLTSYLPVCRRGIESSCNVAGNGPTHVRRTTVPTFAGIGLLHPHCKYCDSRIQMQTRFPLFCDCGTGCKQVENVRNATHLYQKTIF